MLYAALDSKRILAIDTNPDTLTLLTESESMYVTQGYELPEGVTWEQVHAERKRHPHIRAIDVPLARGPKCCAWGVPFTNTPKPEPMRHP